MGLQIIGFPYNALNNYPGSACVLRVYFMGAINGTNFLTDDGAVIACGTVGDDNSPYFSIICTIAGTTINIPTFTLPVADPSNPSPITCTAVFFDSTVTERDTLWSQWTLPQSLEPSCTYPQLFTDNNGLQVPQVSSEVYTIPQINYLLAHLPAPTIQTVLFAALGTPMNGTLYYCPDVVESSYPAQGGGTGSFVFRINNSWRAL